MTETISWDELEKNLATYDSDKLIYYIRQFNAGFTLDFTPQYLKEQSQDRLAHILMTAVLQGKKHTNTKKRRGLISYERGLEQLKQ